MIKEENIITGKHAGFCFGVKNAVETSVKYATNNPDKNIYCLGQLVHNKQVCSKLSQYNIKTIDNINEVKEQEATIIIRAHGVNLDTYKQLEDKNFNIIDLTCPKVKAIQNKIKAYSDNNYFVVVVGVFDHPEVIGLVGHANNSYIINDSQYINTLIDTYNEKEYSGIVVLSQTTFNETKFVNLANQIQNKIKECKIENTICHATKVRQDEIRNLSKEVDCMIVIGGTNSSNTLKLYDISKECCSNTLLVETYNELKDKYIEYQNKKIGIMAGASTPNDSIENVKKYIMSRGKNHD